jgi:hypothetical protein
MNPKRASRYYYLKFTRLQGDPQSLAWGTAIGTFFGITPIIPLHTVINLIVTFLTRTSTIAALLASLIVCNPLTYVPQYYFSTLIGNAVTPYKKRLLFCWLAGQSWLSHSPLPVIFYHCGFLSGSGTKEVEDMFSTDFFLNKLIFIVTRSAHKIFSSLDTCAVAP